MAVRQWDEGDNVVWGYEDDSEWNSLLCFCEVLGGLGHFRLNILLGLHLHFHVQLYIQQISLAHFL